MFLLRTLVLAVTAGLLAGCAVGPDYHRPDVLLLKQYHSQPAVQQRSASRMAQVHAGLGAADLLRRRPDIIVAERHLAAFHARTGSRDEKNRRSGR